MSYEETASSYAPPLPSYISEALDRAKYLYINVTTNHAETAKDAVQAIRVADTYLELAEKLVDMTPSARTRASWKWENVSAGELHKQALHAKKVAYSLWGAEVNSDRD